MAITNLTSDWASGVAIGALLDSIAPGLCPDWDTWNDLNTKINAKEAMELGNEWLDIQLFITPDELCSGATDEKSLMIYLSQFPTAKLRSGAPLRAQRHSNR